MVQKGQYLKFNKIMEEGDDKILFIAIQDSYINHADIEVVLVESQVDMKLKPTYIYPVKDLMLL
jgi:hypothetical protein